jgi:hypothetical protein
MNGMRYSNRLSNSVDDQGWTKWATPVHDGYRLACCTCGLVHNVNFRVRKGQVEMQFQINRRATAAMRRGKRFAVARITDSQDNR